jgi:hypothetical protein
MVTVLSLWLPILLSAVLVFVASSVIHMVLGYHAGDHAAVPGEESVGAAIRAANVPPGQYAMPHAGSMKAMGTPEFAEKMKRGPVALITVLRSGPTSMGKQLGAWFLFNLVVAIFAAYVTSRALGAGGGYGDAFRFAGTTTFVAYGVGSWSESIWFGRKWSTTLKHTLDGLIYALLTGGVFGWLWPGG